MVKIVRVIRWGRRQNTRKGYMRLAIITISIGTIEKPDFSVIDLLKIELMETFYGVQYEHIRFEKRSKSCFGSEGHWCLQWVTPKPGIYIGNYPGWSHLGRPREILEKDSKWAMENPLKAVAEFFRWLKVVL